MEDQDLAARLSEDFPSVCISPASIKQARLSYGRHGAAPTDLAAEMDEENLAPLASDMGAAERSAKKTLRNKRKKERKHANKALREDNQCLLGAPPSPTLAAGPHVCSAVGEDGEAVEEAVREAIACLEEEEELDARTARRLSSERFTCASLRRLSDCGIAESSGAAEQREIDVVGALRAYIALLSVTAVDKPSEPAKEEQQEQEPVLLEMEEQQQEEKETKDEEHLFESAAEGPVECAVPGEAEESYVDESSTSLTQAAAEEEREGQQEGEGARPITPTLLASALASGSARASVAGREAGSAYVTYQVRVAVAGAQVVLADRRYSQLYALQARLARAGCPTSGFPARQWFWESRLSEPLVQARQLALDQWLGEASAALAREDAPHEARALMAAFFL